MKKLFCLTLAAACALSVAAAGLSACGSDLADSDVVTEEEWTAAIANLETYNVTLEATDISSNANSNGITITDSTSYLLKLDLTESDGYLVGNTYLSTNYSYSVDVDEAENRDSEDTVYEIFTDESRSFAGYYVTKTATDSSDGWYGGKLEPVDDLEWQSGLFGSRASTVYPYILFAGMKGWLEYGLSEFTYSKGAYRYSNEGSTLIYEGGPINEWGNSVEVRFNDGYITYFLYEFDITGYDGSTLTKKHEYKFSDYGTTTVSVPEEYTYEYYAANHLN